MLDILVAGESDALLSSSFPPSDQASNQDLLEKEKNHEYRTTKDAHAKRHGLCPGEALGSGM